MLTGFFVVVSIQSTTNINCQPVETIDNTRCEKKEWLTKRAYAPALSPLVQSNQQPTFFCALKQVMKIFWCNNANRELLLYALYFTRCNSCQVLVDTPRHSIVFLRFEAFLSIVNYWQHACSCSGGIMKWYIQYFSHNYSVWKATYNYTYIKRYHKV